MREVDQVQNAVHHRVAQCDQGIHTTQHQAVDDLLDEGIHVSVFFLGSNAVATISIKWASTPTHRNDPTKELF